MKNLTALLMGTILMGCAHSKPNLETVSSLDIQKFMGTWYVIASIPTVFEKNATNAIETYTWNEAEQRIDVDFSFRKDKPEGELKKIPQKAFIHNRETNAEWRIQPFWPLKFAYLVLELDPAYQFTVIGVPSRNYVWIMARTASIDSKIYEKLIEQLKVKHQYDLEELKKVPQVW